MVNQLRVYWPCAVTAWQEVIEKPPDEKESLRAAELLGRRYGMWTEKVEVTSNGKTMIVDDIDG